MYLEYFDAGFSAFAGSEYDNLILPALFGFKDKILVFDTLVGYDAVIAFLDLFDELIAYLRDHSVAAVVNGLLPGLCSQWKCQDEVYKQY